MNDIKVILWDIDGTLLDFHKSETTAIRTLFQRFGFGTCTDSMLEDYSAINVRYWQRLESGELTKPQVLTGRFLEFFEKYHLDTQLVAEFNDAYQHALGDAFYFYPGAKETVASLKGKVLQCAVTNGTAIAQHKKLAGSGLDQLLDAIFISDEMGVEKPNAVFFDRVWQKIGHFPSNEVLIVGDSLTSDIQGGNNAGIRTCWFNPAGKSAPEILRIDYQIRSISQILDIL